ncbi:WXG100 family type VII secretion target [Leucobacter sp. OH2974_COT-288]|uniref:WXG100 family type VII secretion target n=1 Tax=Canibacter oris TaxID=1365628 RepID=A0A840DD54_9MICO|nr:WXG100 family type VII secretion target [Canibacter oris]MBB4070984.1 WXG100 family type VII secretion target [Canibacter oris]RRD36499.1 WXG100 family type VII secretion target [Leucobacter sp. OH2974_COT-288]
MNIRVSYGELEAAAGQIAQGREDMVSRLRLLEQQMQQLVASGFVTELASQKFAASYQQYTQHATGMIEQLSEIELFLRQTAQVLQETDSQIAARIG